jgi:hypothetical protein
MNPSSQTEWKSNALSFAKHPAQITAVARRALLIASATKTTSLTITMPMMSKLSSPKTILVTDKDSLFAKSSAQVAISVRPQVVSPKSCELKLGRRRPYRLMGRFSKEEKCSVEAMAEAAALSVNEYIRAMALGENYTPPNSAELVSSLLALSRELTAQGNNINQIAKHMNGGKASPPAAAETEGATIAAVSAEVTSVAEERAAAKVAHAIKASALKVFGVGAKQFDAAASEPNGQTLLAASDFVRAWADEDVSTKHSRNRLIQKLYGDNLPQIEAMVAEGKKIQYIATKLNESTDCRDPETGRPFSWTPNFLLRGAVLNNSKLPLDSFVANRTTTDKIAGKRKQKNLEL